MLFLEGSFITLLSFLTGLCTLQPIIREGSLNNKSFWKSIPSKPGVYQVYSLDKIDEPKKLQRLLGIDEEGRLYIGKSIDLRERLRMLWRVLQPDLGATAHTFGIKYEKYEALRINFPLETLAISYICDDKAKDLESNLQANLVQLLLHVPKILIP